MKIGFIGIGNMGSAIATSIAKIKNQDIQLLISNHNIEKAEKFKTQVKALVKILENEAIVKEADVIFLGVKPYLILEVLGQLAPIAKEDALWISMATAVSLKQLMPLLDRSQAIIRIMPNTPVEIGEGMITYVLPEETSQKNHSLLVDLLANTGRLQQINENQMDAASAIAGCGPAFIYQLIEALSDAGVREGLNRALAQNLAAQMVQGAAQMVLKTGKHPGQLKDEVTSPGGSTIAGITSLEENGFRYATMEAVHQAYLKTISLSKNDSDNH